MNYKETSVAGTSWMRCRAVSILNPLAGGSPSALFHEERVVDSGGLKTSMDCGSCIKHFAADGTIAMRDHSTGELTGESTTHGELYTILFSLYMQTATERDAAG